MRNDPHRQVQTLLKTLLTASLSEIETYLKGSVAAVLVSDKIAKIALSLPGLSH